MSQERRCVGGPSRIVLAVLCLIVVAIVCGQGLSAQSEPGRWAKWPPVLAGPAPGELEVLHVRGNVYMLAGAGANIAVQVGSSGKLMVDTGVAAMSDKVIAAMQKLSPAPLRYIVNTTEREDYSGGNEKIAVTGEIIPWREPNYQAGPQGALNVHKASVISYLTVFHRMAAADGKRPARGEDAWPDNTYSISQKRLYFNDEPVVITHVPSTTDGNSVVLFRRSDVVSTGELLDLTAYPRIDVAAGGSIEAVVDGLNRLIDITVPESKAQGGTLVIPGKGRLADHAEVVYYRDMTAIIRDRIKDMVGKGMSLEQVKAARPTRDYDARYGKTGGWTADMFVEAAYQSLKKG